MTENELNKKHADFLLVKQNMERHGDLFFKELAKAMRFVNLEQAYKIKQAFPEEWNTYLNWDK